MKKTVFITKFEILSVMLIFLALIFSAGAYAQDTITKKEPKVIRIKVNTDGDGESVTIDTSFTIDDEFDEEAFEAYMSDFDDKMKEMEVHLEKLDFDEAEWDRLEDQFKEMEIHLEGVGKECDHYKKAMKAYKHCIPRHMEFYSQRPHHYYCAPDHHRDIVRWHEKPKGESLSDVLGDIPMSAVKSYKIRDTKYGKKIVIEVNDDYPGEFSEEVILIRTPEVPEIRVTKPRIKREIIIETEDDEDAGDR